MSSPAPAGRPRGGLSRRQALAGLGIALAGGVSGRAASARAAVAPARHARAGLAAGLTNLQLAGQRVIGFYPGLTPTASLFTDISNGQVAVVIFFGENISSATSTTFPAAVTGFVIDDETVSSCTAVKKTASPKP